MAELEVIYDPDMQIAAVVNVDEQCGWGPAMIGPNAKQLLTLFIDTVPFDVSQLASSEATAAFKSFLEQANLAGGATTAAGGNVAAKPDGNPPVDEAAALAQREAANSGDVSPPAPADTDTPTEGESTQAVITCPNCNGTTTTNDGPEGTAVPCGFCKGLGHVKATA